MRIRSLIKTWLNANPTRSGSTLAELLNCSPQHVNNLLNSTRPLSDKMVPLFAAAIGVSEDEVKAAILADAQFAEQLARYFEQFPDIETQAALTERLRRAVESGTPIPAPTGLSVVEGGAGQAAL